MAPPCGGNHFLSYVLYYLTVFIAAFALFIVTNSKNLRERVKNNQFLKYDMPSLNNTMFFILVLK
ncbi:MAG: hypothetical protein ACI9AV_000835 [Sediminicola sp.]